MTIPNRDEQHGGLEAVGGVSRRIKDIMQLSGRNWHRLTPGEQEALDMIAHKIGRILSGADPHDPEHWRDVAGYAVAARRGDGEAVPEPKAAPEDEPEAEQQVNRWRNDRAPESGDLSEEDGTVWVWSNIDGQSYPARIRKWEAILLGGILDKIFYWAPGNLPVPTDPPPGWEPPAPPAAMTTPPPPVDANGWTRSRQPTAADLHRDIGHVLIPVGNGATTATIDYTLVVPGQPWARFDSSPGRFEL